LFVESGTWDGYTQKNIDSLRDGLLSIANEEEVNDIINTIYGTKYIINGNLNPTSWSARLNLMISA